MTQELGRVERPAAERYRGRRKLLLAPLVYSPQADDAEGAVALQNYWAQMQTQVAALAASIGPLRRLYHESVTAEGDEGLALLEAGDRRSYEFIAAQRPAGAALEATEDLEALLETLDWQRCLMLPLASPAAAARLQEWHSEANRARYDYIARRIDATLGQDELGLLLISERHQVQFPADIEVFYISPPALDDFRRWLQNWLARQQSPAPGPAGDAAADFAGAGDADEGDATAEET